MTHWPSILHRGWPGKPFVTHQYVDKRALASVLPESQVNAVVDAMAQALRTRGILAMHDVIAYTTNPVTDPLPTIEEIQAKKTEIEALISAEEAKRLELRQFARDWPPDKIIEAWNDEQKRPELIAAMNAQGG